MAPEELRRTKRILLTGGTRPRGTSEYLQQEVKKVLPGYTVNLCMWIYKLEMAFFGQYCEGRSDLISDFRNFFNKRRNKTLPALVIYSGLLRHYDDLEDMDSYDADHEGDIVELCHKYHIPDMRYDHSDIVTLVSGTSKIQFIEDLELKIKEIGIS